MVNIRPARHVLQPSAVGFFQSPRRLNWPWSSMARDRSSAPASALSHLEALCWTRPSHLSEVRTSSILLSVNHSSLQSGTSNSQHAFFSLSLSYSILYTIYSLFISILYFLTLYSLTLSILYFLSPSSLLHFSHLHLQAQEAPSFGDQFGFDDLYNLGEPVKPVHISCILPSPYHRALVWAAL